MKKNKKMGRPPFYKTPDELRAAVDLFFESCKGTPVYDADGLPVTTRTGAQKMAGEIPPTISGLSLALGFKDRHTFTEQGKRSAAFLEVVQYARLRVEAYTEARLYDPASYRGAAFMLQACFGWGKEKEPDALPAVAVKVIEAPPAETAAAAAPAADDPAMLPAHGISIELLN